MAVAVRIRRNHAFRLILVLLIVCLMFKILFLNGNSSSRNKHDKGEVKIKKLPDMLSLTEEFHHKIDQDLKKFELPKIKTTRPISKLRIQNEAKIELATGFNSSRYALDISKDRLDRLFDILQTKEEIYNETLDEINAFSFKKLADGGNKADKLMLKFTEEFFKYLKVEKGKVEATELFVNYLKAMSEKHSFQNPRNNVVKAAIDQDKPTIVTAANSAYFNSLQATVANVHENFPDYKLVIYDLGLDPHQLEMTKLNCRCEVVKFDLNKIAQRHSSPHIINLSVFAWKPLIVHHALRTHPILIYIDTSIRFHSNQLQPMFITLREVGLLTQYIQLKLVCYTNPKQFEWFGDTANTYKDFYTMEAGLLFVRDSFLTRIILKAWVTCALDVNCIAPAGSRVSNCCGCHRYDQDALTVVSSFFFAHPKTYDHLPAYSFTKEESYFFEIRRYEGRMYFTMKGESRKV